MIRNYIIKNNNRKNQELKKMIGAGLALGKYQNFGEVKNNVEEIKDKLLEVYDEMNKLNEALKEADKDMFVDENKYKEIEAKLDPLIKKIKEYDDEYKLENTKLNEIDMSYINIKQNLNALVNFYNNILKETKDIDTSRTGESYEEKDFNKIKNIKIKIDDSLIKLFGNFDELINQINQVNEKIETEINKFKKIYIKSFEEENLNKYIYIKNEIIDFYKLNETEITMINNIKILPDKINEIKNLNQYFLELTKLDNAKIKSIPAKFLDLKKYMYGGELFNVQSYNLIEKINLLNNKIGILRYNFNYLEQIKIRYFYYLFYLNLLINRETLNYKTNFIDKETLEHYKNLVSYIINNLKNNELKYFGKYHLITLLKVDNFIKFLWENFKNRTDKEIILFNIENIHESSFYLDYLIFSSFRKILDDYAIYKKINLINRYYIFKQIEGKQNVIYVFNNITKFKEYFLNFETNKIRVYLQSGEIDPNTGKCISNKIFHYKIESKKIDYVNNFADLNNFENYDKFEIIKDPIDNKSEFLNKFITFVETFDNKFRYVFVILPSLKNSMDLITESINSENDFNNKILKIGIYLNPMALSLLNSELILDEFNNSEENLRREIIGTKIQLVTGEFSFLEEKTFNINLSNFIQSDYKIVVRSDQKQYEKFICLRLLYRILKLNKFKLINRIIKNFIIDQKEYKKINNQIYNNEFVNKLLNPTNTAIEKESMKIRNFIKEFMENKGTKEDLINNLLTSNTYDYKTVLASSDATSEIFEYLNYLEKVNKVEKKLIF